LDVLYRILRSGLPVQDLSIGIRDDVHRIAVNLIVLGDVFRTITIDPDGHIIFQDGSGHIRPRKHFVIQLAAVSAPFRFEMKEDQASVSSRDVPCVVQIAHPPEAALGEGRVRDRPQHKGDKKEASVSAHSLLSLASVDEFIMSAYRPANFAELEKP